jgi:alcohol dehydrogenase class IV
MSVHEFRYEALPSQVLFGSGTLNRLPEETSRLQLERVLIVSTPGHLATVERVMSLLGGVAVSVFANAAMHTPAEITDAALVQARNLEVQGIVAIGGGSAIGLSKALALRTDWPQIVIPTTYAGSEATPVLGETSQGIKQTQRSLKVLPESIIYDVDLTLRLPVPISMASGLNAMAHAAEALYSVDRNPLTSLMADQALSRLIEALPRIHSNARDLEARTNALYGAWLCGCCLGHVRMALHHKLCHTLGGAFGLPHAQTHAALLPHALAYNLPRAPEAAETLARLLKHQEPAVALEHFARALQLPRSLRELGMPRAGIDRAADLATQNSYPNPRPIEREAIRSMLARAWAGDLPSTAEPAHA